jgi:diguanylate cyclase (GGDEF)-like protein
MDLLAFVAGVAGLAALASTGFGWRLRGRALRAEAQAARLRAELRAERHAASHDPLTGLPNRRGFYQAGSALIADPAGYPLIAIVVDLDDFKRINDRFGHAAGDEVLVVVARRLAGYAGGELVARIGGDEFAGLLRTPTVDSSWLHRLTRRLTGTLAEPMPVAGNRLTVTASVGLVPVCRRVHLADALHQADTAMYRAKLHRQRTAPLAHRMTWFHPELPDELQLADAAPDGLPPATVRHLPGGRSTGSAAA